VEVSGFMAGYGWEGGGAGEEVQGREPSGEASGGVTRGKGERATGDGHGQI